MPFRATQDGKVIVESSDKTWSTAVVNDKPLQYACCESPVNSMKRQKYMTLEDEPSELESIQYATGEEQRVIANSSRKNEVSWAKVEMTVSCGCVYW